VKPHPQAGEGSSRGPSYTVFRLLGEFSDIVGGLTFGSEERQKNKTDSCSHLKKSQKKNTTYLRQEKPHLGTRNLANLVKKI